MTRLCGFPVQTADKTGRDLFVKPDKLEETMESGNFEIGFPVVICFWVLMLLALIVAAASDKKQK